MAKTNFHENAWINHVLRNTPYTAPTTVYIALLTAVTDVEGSTFTEVSGGAYARQSVTFGAPSNGTASNTNTVTFPQATANNGTVTHFAIMTASSAGNALYIAPVTTPFAYSLNVQPVFNPGTITVTEN